MNQLNLFSTVASGNAGPGSEASKTDEETKSYRESKQNTNAGKSIRGAVRILYKILLVALLDV